MRLIFLYVQHRHGFYFAERVREEGYFHLIRRMVETGIVDEAVILIESGQEGRVDYGHGMHCLIGSDIGRLLQAAEPGDVIWARGGWRSWFTPLQEAGRDHWLMFYAANTDRWKWPIWDVILDDCHPSSVIPAKAGIQSVPFVDPAGRIHVDFRKPINETLFCFRREPCAVSRAPSFDLCIGASRVHDRKGQWRAINAMIAYKQVYGRDLTAVLPGPWSHGTETSRIEAKIVEHNLLVRITGELSRKELCDTFNRSRVFAHLGSHGQGDRGPMEAMACGCPILIGFPRYHAPWVLEAPFCHAASNPDSPAGVAGAIRQMLTIQHAQRRQIAEYCTAQCGIDAVGIPAMRRLFSAFTAIGRPDRAALAEALLCPSRPCCPSRPSLSSLPLEEAL